MIEQMRKLWTQRHAPRQAVQQQEQAKLARVAEIKTLIPMVKELLRDPRYQRYAALLVETKQSCEAEREALLRGLDSDDPQTRPLRIGVLTGRIMQLEYILDAPDNFLALAESGEANGNAASLPGASVRMVAAK